MIAPGCGVACLILLIAGGAASGQDFTIGQSFTGSSFNLHSSFKPPDTMGAVGPGHVVEIINGRYRVYDRSGAQLQSKTLNQFWTDSGAGFEGAFAFDPRVVYDAASGRYFAVSVDNLRDDNNFLVAVSNSTDPTTAWHGFQIDSDPLNVRWADFPMLGHNADVVIVAANMFSQTGQTATSNVSVLALPKADLLAPVPTVAAATLLDGIDVGLSLQPAVDLDQGTGALPMLTAAQKATGSLRRSDLLFNQAVASFSPGTLIPVTPHSPAPDAEQPGHKRKIRTDDGRFSGNVLFQDDSLWAVHNVQVNGRAAVEWYQIGASDDQVLRSGLIEDPELAFYYPSIAVNDDGDVVIGFSGSGDDQFVSSYVAVGKVPATGPAVFSPPALLKAGVSDYQVLDGSGRNRWGDYSATVKDPLKSRSFWTFQQYVSAEDVWSVQITQIIVPEPGTGLLIVPWACLLLLRRS